MGRKFSFRNLVQLMWALVTNINIKGFMEGKIYKGNLKGICLPGLNCYSCPGAMGSCPIGSMQAVIGSMKYKFSFYVLGFLMFIGVMLGRFICGWLCPFGFFQELIHKIPTPKIKVPKRVNRWMKYTKHVILIVFVLLLPLFLQDRFGMSDPYFCKYICPAGMLEGGIPLILKNESLRGALGALFSFKMTILIIVILASMVIYRFFCRYMCPLGAFYSLFSKISFYRYSLDEEKCTSCGLCESTCKLDIEVYKDPNQGECIRCGECIKACPHSAIKRGSIKRECVAKSLK